MFPQFLNINISIGVLKPGINSLKNGHVLSFLKKIYYWIYLTALKSKCYRYNQDIVGTDNLFSHSLYIWHHIGIYNDAI